MSFILLNDNYGFQKNIGYEFGIQQEISKNIGYSWHILFSLDIGYSWQTVVVPVSKNMGYSFIIYEEVLKNIGYEWNNYEYASGTIPYSTGFEFFSNKRRKDFWS